MKVDVEGAENNAAPELKGKLGYDAGGFHAAVACSICYIAMQMTNWNQEFSKDDVDKGSASMWVKIVASWVLAVAYGWAMIAPKVLTDRDFS
jgi:hypothetical protein